MGEPRQRSYPCRCRDMIVEKRTIIDALEKNNGNIPTLPKAPGVSRATLHKALSVFRNDVTIRARVSGRSQCG